MLIVGDKFRLMISMLFRKNYWNHLANQYQHWHGKLFILSTNTALYCAIPIEDIISITYMFNLIYDNYTYDVVYNNTRKYYTRTVWGTLSNKKTRKIANFLHLEYTKYVILCSFVAFFIHEDFSLIYVHCNVHFYFLSTIKTNYPNWTYSLVVQMTYCQPLGTVREKKQRFMASFLHSVMKEVIKLLSVSFLWVGHKDVNQL